MIYRETSDSVSISDEAILHSTDMSWPHFLFWLPSKRHEPNFTLIQVLTE